jgi:signal transduction histidine kinase
MKSPVKINWVAVIWSVLVFSMLASGWWVFRVQVTEAQNRAVENIVSIGKLKLIAIEQFLDERLADAAILSEDKLLVENISQWFDSADPASKANVLYKFKVLMDNYHYSNAVLADASGNVKLSILEGRKELEKESRLALGSSLNADQPAIIDLHLDNLSGKPQLDVIAPIYREGPGEKKLIGYFSLEMDPYLFLYSFIESWPVASRTAETLLVRRQGDKVAWLTGTRFQPGSALKMEQALSEIERPAVQAVLGAQGIFRGKDYRGKEVISYLAQVPKSPWFLVTKVDAQEVFTPAYQKIFSYFFVTVLFLMLAMMITFNLTQRVKYFSQLHEKDNEIGRYVTQLENINKELEAFSYSISHDLKAPLRAITGYASILFEEYSMKLDQEAKRLINVIHDNVNKMSCLIDDLLTLSHAGRQAMQIADVDMTQLAQMAYDELKEILPVDRQIQVIIQDLPPARADSVLVKQVLVNLISNAVKFTSLREKALIQVAGYSRAEGNVYYIKDNGAGFDMKYAGKLFGVFSRLHTQEEFSGTGIGLAIVKNAILRMGGRVWAQGEIDQGASFYFSLPKGG